MNLLTNGFVNNCGRLFGPSEQFEADIVELGLKGFCVNGGESRYPCRRFRGITGKPEVILSWRYQGESLIDLKGSEPNSRELG
jgi:hypothetical protein